MNTQTQTQNKSFTITEARYIAAKIATDLNLLHALYSNPSIERAAQFAEEVALYLNARYLSSVEYGFKKDGVVVLSLKYTVRADGSLVTDDRPGKIPSNLDRNGLVFYSYLRQSMNYYLLAEPVRNSFLATLPFQRTAGEEPKLSANGNWENTLSYSKNGEGVQRGVFRLYG